MSIYEPMINQQYARQHKILSKSYVNIIDVNISYTATEYRHL